MDDEGGLSFTMVLIAIPLVFGVSLGSAAGPGLASRCRGSADFTSTTWFQFVAGCGSGALLSIGLVHSFSEGVES